MNEQLTVAAKPGEVWAFSVEGEEVIVGFAVVGDVWGRIEFRTVLGNVLKRPTTVYTDARCIWPEREQVWEYGVRLHPDIEYKSNENLSTHTPPTTPHPSLKRAQEMADLNPRYRPTYHRRRRAGAWEPVKQEPSPSPRTFPNPDNRDDDDGIGLLGGAPRW